MKKILLGCALLAFAVLVSESVITGCGSGPAAPAPVTVTQTSNCGGAFGFGYIGPSNTASLNLIEAEGVSIVAPGPVTAFNIGLFVINTSTVGQLRAALYAGTTSGPTTLIAQSAAVTDALNQWIELPIPSTALSPGYYWLAVMAQNTSYFSSDLSNTTGYFFATSGAVSFGAFPATMPSGTTNNYTACFYANTCP